MATKKFVRVNRDIRAREVRLIDADGTQMGIIPLEDAMAVATERDLDLVEVAPDAEPPVCKIMDFGKYKYEQSKRTQLARKKSTTIQVKEVKFRPKIEDHDYGFKLRNALKFLDQKNKVKVTIMFRGREIAFTELGYQLLDRMMQDVEEHAVVEQQPRMEGRNLTMVLSPRA